MAVDRHFKPIIKPLQQIVDSPLRAIKKQSHDDDVGLPPSMREKRRRRRKRRERKRAKCPSVPRSRVNPMIDFAIVYSR